MGKFSDLPRFLLNDYFEESLSSVSVSSSTIQGSYLQGGRSSVTVDGGYWTKIWIKVDTVNYEDATYPGMTEYKFRINDSIRNNDHFIFSFGSLLTLPASANGTFDSGSEVYFRKGSYMYEWLINNSTLYENYFNTNKMWLYFGKIYKASAYENSYYIIFDGMKNFVMNALPNHQRTTNLTEFMRLYFDKVYHEIYNMTKNLSSLIDAREIDTDHIEYMAKNYDVSLDEDMSGMALREWVENLPYLLKRKGTYSSIFIIWKTLLRNTLNNLNVYDRWHTDLTGSTDIPLGHFLDILHQMEYGVRPEGCAGSYWYEKAFTLASATTFVQNNVVDVWDIYHEMFSRNIMVQCFNAEFERIWPDSIVSINSGLVRITFGQKIAGYAFMIRRGDYLHDNTETTSLLGNKIWNINHQLGVQDVLSQYQDQDYSTIMPDVVNLYSINVINTTFGKALKGYGMVQNEDVERVDQSASATTWTLNHGLGKRVFVQAFNDDDDMIQPKTITLNNDGSGTVVLTFETAQSGYALFKLSESETTLPTYDTNDMILSPHYRVEVDLSCEPLDDDLPTPSILSESTIDRLVENWELMRPVSRYSHYHELISPKTDFTGNNIPLYGPAYKADLKTKYVTSGSELTPAPDSDVFIYNQYVNQSTWTASHTLSAQDWIVQCYDNDDYRMWPKEIYPVGTNRVVLEFDQAVNGHAVFVEMTSPSGSSYTEPVSSAWDVLHSEGYKEVLSQFDNTLKQKVVPSATILEGVNDIRVEWASALAGKSQISNYDTVYTQTTPATGWTMNHELGTDSMVGQFFNENDAKIRPNSVYLDDRNKATATFATPVSGYAVLRGVNNVVTEAGVMDSIENGGIWVIGQGTSGSDYNPLISNNVESILTSGSDLDVDNDDDYYYIDFEVDNIINNGEDWDITEVLILNNERKPKFYSAFDYIHKPEDLWFNVHMRVERSQT